MIIKTYNSTLFGNFLDSLLMTIIILARLWLDILKFTIKAFYFLLPLVLFATFTVKFEKTAYKAVGWDIVTPSFLIDLFNQSIDFSLLICAVIAVFWVCGKAIGGKYFE